MPTTGVLGALGDLVEDVVVWPATDIRHGTDTQAAVHRVRGGSAANVAGMAAPRWPTRFLGCVGPDHTGDALVAELSGRGVDVRVQRHGTTGTIVVIVEVDGERTMFPARGACLELQRVDDDWLAGLACLHVPSYSLIGPGTLPASAQDAVLRAGAGGAAISVDVSSEGLVVDHGVEAYRGLLAELRPTVIFANQTEAKVVGVDALTASAPLVVVKRGADPAVLVAGRRQVEVPVGPVTAVRDLTGAGDAFAAGFLTAALADGWPSAGLDAAESWVRAGHRAAATVLSSPGGAAPR